MVGSVLSVPGCDRICDAVLHMGRKQPGRDGTERSIDGGDLCEDVDAVSVLLDHASDPADLTLDPSQAAGERCLVVGVPRCW